VKEKKRGKNEGVVVVVVNGERKREFFLKIVMKT